MINPPANPKATVSKGPTWPEVVAMYRELGLLVCDDEEAIRDEFEKRKLTYLTYIRKAGSPDHTRNNIENAQALMTASMRSRYIRIVYDAFSANADVLLACLIQSDQIRVPPEFKESLVQLAEKAYSTRRDLAERFTNTWLRQFVICDAK
jgi:hypothetical protein